MNDTDTHPPETVTETPESPAPAIKRNVLGTRQIVALWGWCERNRDSLATTQNPKLAAIAQAELEFQVTTANIAGMLEEMGIEKRKPDAPPTLEEQVMRLAAAWRQQDERHTDLLTTLRVITERLNRLERRHEETHPQGPDPAQPELAGLPVPAFGGTAPLPLDVDVRQSADRPTACETR